MNINFPLILVVATFATGLIWALDALVWAPRRRAVPVQAEAGGSAEAAVAKEPVIVEYSRSFFPILLLVLVVRSFVVEPFRIPSGSMTPTLLEGDFILVNKFSYGLRLPVVNKEFFGVGKPQRGDIIVFRYPEDPSIDYIKRVVGLPGDRVEYRNKVVYVNGKPMQQEYQDVYVGEGSSSAMTSAIRLREDLTGMKHDILVIPGLPDPAQYATPNGEPVWVVPEGHYFMMGDNRDNSRDSRYWNFVPDENLVGKAFFIWMHFDSGRIAWSRIGSSIH